MATRPCLQGIQRICRLPRGHVAIEARLKDHSEDGLDRLNDSWRTCPFANEDDPVNLRRVDAGVIEGFLARVDGALNKGGSERLELGSHELLVGVLRSTGAGQDKRQVDLRLSSRRKLNLGLFRSLTDTLNCPC